MNPSELDVPGDVCDQDDDNDGVLDAEDECHFSIIPEIVPTEKLLPMHYADIDGDGFFESISSKTKGVVQDAVPFGTTFGCSCKEILAKKPGDTLGEFKFGCTKGTLDVWAATRGWAK